jgi:hypothetical protein
MLKSLAKVVSSKPKQTAEDLNAAAKKRQSTARRQSVSKPAVDFKKMPFMMAYTGNISGLREQMDADPFLVRKPVLVPVEAPVGYVRPPISAAAATPENVRNALDELKTFATGARLSDETFCLLTEHFVESQLLHFACAGDQFHIVKMLLVEDVDTAASNREGYEPAHYTSRADIRELIEEHDDEEEDEEEDDTPPQSPPHTPPHSEPSTPEDGSPASWDDIPTPPPPPGRAKAAPVPPVPPPPPPPHTGS